MEGAEDMVAEVCAEEGGDDGDGVEGDDESLDGDLVWCHDKVWILNAIDKELRSEN